MKALILLFMLNLTQADPKFYPPEAHRPYYHMGFSAFSQSGTYSILRLFEVSKRTSYLLSFPLGMMPGLAKELFDMKTNKEFNTADMMYNYIGVMMGLNLTVVWDLDWDL